MAERDAPDLAAGGGLDVKERSPAPPAQDAGFDRIVRSAVSDLQTDAGATRKTLDVNREKSANILTRLEASEKDRPVAPDIAKPEPPPQHQKPTDALSAFGSAASVLAIFGAFATRAPLTAALNASAAAMGAIKNRDDEAFEREHKIWKEQSEYAGKVAEWNLERYRMTLDNWKGTQEGLFGQLRAISALDQDTLAQHAMKTGDLQVVEKFMADRQAQVERFQDHRLKLDEFAERSRHDLAMENTPERNAYFLERKLHPEKDPAEIIRSLKATTNNPSARILDSAMEQWRATHNGQDMPYDEQAKVLASTKNTTPRSAPAMYLKSWLEEHPEAKPKEIAKAMADYRAQGAAEVGFGPTGAQGKNMAAISTAINHIDSWEKLATKAATGDVHAFNSLWNSFRSEIAGDPTGTNAQIAAQFVGPEIVKSIVATGGGVEERDQIKKLLSTRLSPEQVKGSADTAREFLAGRMGPLKQMWEKSVGGSGEEFEETYLSPRAREVFRGLTAKSEKGDIARQAEQSWGTYEPDKYDYRMNPETGTLQRKAK